MAPTIESLEQQIGRRLKRGDVLVNRPFNRDTDFLEEVVDPTVTEDPKRARDSWRGAKPAVKVRELTAVGPMSDYTIAERHHNDWMDIIKVEDRTDTSKLQLLLNELRRLVLKK